MFDDGPVKKFSRVNCKAKIQKSDFNTIQPTTADNMKIEEQSGGYFLDGDYDTLEPVNNDTPLVNINLKAKKFVTTLKKIPPKKDD